MNRIATELRYHKTKYYGIRVQEEIFPEGSYYFLIEDFNGSDVFTGKHYPSNTELELFVNQLTEEGE